MNDAIRFAALQAVAMHLGGFEYSTALEDLWEDHSGLHQDEMDEASNLAIQIADSTRNALLQGFTPVELTITESGDSQ